MQSEKIQKEIEKQQLLQMMEDNVDKKIVRIFICSNINELFNMNVEMGEKPQIYKIMEKVDKIGVKIITEYPWLYKLLCILRINKIYAYAKISMQKGDQI